MQDFVAHPEHGIAWISGASSGIGRALALKLADEGYKVAVTARDHEELAELQAEASDLSGSIIVLDGDVTNAEDMEHVLASIEYGHGALALAVFNAGVCLPVHAQELKLADFQQSFAVNLQGVVNCLVPTIRHMKAKGQGQIAIVSSVAGYGGLPSSAAYGATKAALINMAESLKFDLDKMGIRIQLINPGFSDTPATKNNEFPLPPLASLEEAAEQISTGLKSRGFEITFPKRVTYMMKLVNLLPYGLYFRLINRSTGWRPRPLDKHARPVMPHPAE
ncbi:NAD(P)-dependent dehydrogenase (short-subunit alcohol dehydrogenase family) [Rhizobium mesoamericanum]|uniref:SDR family NAD(P)-dependent oxidoreductase n=1 Tax=Rhizobium mesoamericanum TaxID=1079800 RepID=UPI002781AAA4|nr:SDR family NAD(P)-dependent oxidoreductase [Rhizobium mesoamericanum]MDQ0561466.1 NAD(P)-dependent dehydrogenase (short-subunit alcohol dehydrogenase family) [Rhizobium mesoamericanum]